MKRRKKWTLRRILSLGLAVLMIVGAVAGIAAVTKRLTADQKTISPTFERGCIDANTGKAVETNSSLYTPEAFPAKGLEIQLDFDAHLSYQIFWYDEYGTFKYCTDVMTQGGEWYTPVNCQARLVITPLWNELDDDDGEIAWYEKWTYTSGIEILVDKDQTVPRNKYKEYSLNDTDMFTHKTDKYYDPGVNKDLWPEAEGVHFYIWANDEGRYSALFLESKEDAVLQNLQIVVLLHDDTVVQYYYDGVGKYINGKPCGGVPTYEDPLAVPKGASVYFLVDGNVVNPDDLSVFFY